MAQQVEDPTLSLLWLWSQLWHGFDPWSRTSTCLGHSQKTKQNKSKKTLGEYDYDIYRIFKMN